MGTGGGAAVAQSIVRYHHTYLHNLSFHLSGHCFITASPEEPDCRTYIGEKTKGATGFAHRRKYPGGIYLRSLYLLYLSVRSLPLDRTCQIVLFISAQRIHCKYTLKRIIHQWEIRNSVSLLFLFEHFFLTNVHLILHPYTLVC